MLRSPPKEARSASPGRVTQQNPNHVFAGSKLPRQGELFHAIPEERFGEAMKAAGAKGPKQQVKILGAPQASLIFVLSKPVATPHPRRMREGKTPPGLPANLLMGRGDSRFTHDFSFAFEVDSAAAKEVHLRVQFQKPHLPGQPIRKCKVVSIHPREVFSAAQLSQFVKPRRQPQ